MDSSGRPENLLFTHILVPPVCIRPSVHMDGGGSNEDDLTVKLQSIMVSAGLGRILVSEKEVSILFANLVQSD